MRKHVVLLSSLAAMILAGLGAGNASAAACDVLTYGSTCNGLGTNNVTAGDILSADIEPGTQADFVNGSFAISCFSAGLGGRLTNAHVPGTATGALTSFSIASCTASFGSVTATISADGSISVSAANVVTLQGQQITYAFLGTRCEYETTTPATDTGTFSNSNSAMYFRLAVTLVSGGGICPGGGQQTLDVGPVLDTSRSDAHVFLNG